MKYPTVYPGMVSSGSNVKNFMNKIHWLFPDFDFSDGDEGDDIFLEASRVTKESVESSY